MKIIWRIILLSATLLSLLYLNGAQPPFVFAHANILETSPQQGSTLSAPPREIVITFDQPVRPVLPLRLIAEGFSEIQQLKTTADQNQVIGQVIAMSPGKWTVQWAAISADGDQINGTYQFEVLPLSYRWRWILLGGALASGLIAVFLRSQQNEL